jgi:hypothetical protein
MSKGKAINTDYAKIPKWKSTKYLDEKIANYPDKLNLELDRLQLSFKYYNNDLCEVHLFERNIARRAIQNFKTIGKSTDTKSLKDNGIDLLPVYNKGDYKKLFTKQITEDTQLKEHKIQSDARIFYFLVGKEFNIVAITNKHYETDKNK